MSRVNVFSGVVFLVAAIAITASPAGAVPAGGCCVYGPSAVSCSVEAPSNCGSAGGVFHGLGTTCDLSYVENAALAIPDNNATGVASTIGVPSSRAIADINVDIGITHTWVSDLIVDVTSPAGTTRGLWRQRCGSADNINATADDEGTETLCAVINAGPINSVFFPPALAGDGPLSVFDGENMQGTWTMNVSDHFGGDVGTLNQWSLHFGPRCFDRDYFSTRSSHYAGSTLLQQHEVRSRSVSGGPIALDASFLTPWVGLDALEALGDGTFWFSTLNDGVVDGLLLQHESAYHYDPFTDTIDPTPVLDGVALGLRSLDAIADLGPSPTIAFSVSYDQFGPTLKQQNVYILVPPSNIVLGIDLAARGLRTLDGLDLVPGPTGIVDLSRPIVSTASWQFLSTPSGTVFVDHRNAYQLDLNTSPLSVTPVLTGPFVDLDAIALARGIFP